MEEPTCDEGTFIGSSSSLQLERRGCCKQDAPGFFFIGNQFEAEFQYRIVGSFLDYELLGCPTCRQLEPLRVAEEENIENEQPFR